MSLTRQLRRYGRRPPLPLSVPLADGRVLEFSQWLRILPGKRLVGQASLDGEQVLAKLFIAPGAARHWAREKRGVEALIGQGTRREKRKQHIDAMAAAVILQGYLDNERWKSGK